MIYGTLDIYSEYGLHSLTVSYSAKNYLNWLVVFPSLCKLHVFAVPVWVSGTLISQAVSSETNV